MKKIIKILSTSLLVCALCALSYYIGGHDVYVQDNELHSVSYKTNAHEFCEDSWSFYHIIDQVYYNNPEIFKNVIQEAPGYQELIKDRFPYAKSWKDIQNIMEE